MRCWSRKQRLRDENAALRGELALLYGEGRQAGGDWRVSFRAAAVRRPINNARGALGKKSAPAASLMGAGVPYLNERCVMSHRVHQRFASRLGLVVLAAVVAIVGAVQLAAAEPADAIPGLTRKGHHGLKNNEPFKGVVAECPDGMHVIGGGGSVDDGGRRSVKLISLTPYTSPVPDDDIPDHFAAAAEAPHLTRSFEWRISAYALCAPASSLRSYEIVGDHVSNSTSQPFVTAWVRCPGGTVAYGSGAFVSTGGVGGGLAAGEVGLQMTRTSGPMDIARSAAHETLGYGGTWSLSSYAICAEPQGDIHVEGALSQGSAVGGSCPSGYQVHGPGGGGGLIDGGTAWLQKIVPRYPPTGVDVALTRPLDPSVGGMIAHFTCAR
jgi:hypothetical protein